MSETSQLRRARRLARKAGYIVHKFPDLHIENDSIELHACEIHGGECTAGRFEMERGHWRSHTSVWSGDLTELEDFLRNGTCTNENTPGAESRGCNRMDAEGNEPTTQMMKEGSAMNVPTTTPDTAWLGEYVGELTAEQIDKLNFLRSSMQPSAGFSEDVDGVLLSDAAGEVEHNRLQASMAAVPLPSWAPDAGTGWDLWNDGKLRRGHDLATWPSIRSALDTIGSFSTFAGACEVQDSPPVFYVDVYADNARLTPAEARQAAQQLLEAADKLDEVAQ